MTYVARFTNDPKADMERGWSGWMGHQWPTLESALNAVAAENIQEEALEERQMRWMNTWGEQYADFEFFKQQYFEELAETMSLRFAEPLSMWRAVHHEGLSCWSLQSSTAVEAIAEARTLAESRKIGWGGFGQVTFGAVTLVAPVEGVDDLYVCECEDVGDE